MPYKVYIIFLIISQMEVATQLEHDTTKQMYQRLIDARDKPIDSDDTIKRDIEGSRTFQETFCCTDPVYKEQIEIIKSTQPNTVIDKTVGAYLYGCFQPELAVEISCTPACADGVNGLKNPDLSSCELASYEKNRDGILVKLNGINSEDANLFLASNQSLTKDDKAVLVQDGVKITTIYNQDGNTINYILGESIDVSQPTPTDSNQPTTNSSGNSSGWGWVWLIIIIIIIILLVALALRM